MYGIRSSRGLGAATAAVSALTAQYYPAGYINVGTEHQPIMIPPVFSGQDTSVPGYAQNAAADASGQVGGTLFTWPDGTVHNFNFPPLAHAQAALYVPGVGTWAGTTPGYSAIDTTSGDITVNGKVVANFIDPNFDAAALNALVLSAYAAANPDSGAAVAAGPAIHIDATDITPTIDPNTPPPNWNLGTFNGTQGYWAPDGKFYAGATPWLTPNAVGLSINQGATSTDPATLVSTPTPGTDNGPLQASLLPATIAGISTPIVLVAAAGAFLLFRGMRGKGAA